MKLLMLFLFAFMFQSYSITVAQEMKVSLNCSNATLEQAVVELKKQTNLNYFYKKDDLKRYAGINAHFQGEYLSKVLESLLKGTDLDFEITNNIILIKKNNKQTKPKADKIKGKVTDGKGNPMPGVTVILKGTSTGTSTDKDGNFILAGKKGDVLVFTFIGMKSQEVKYDGKNLYVKMEEDKKELDEVIVNGYFIKKKESFTGAAKTFNKEDILNVSNQNLLTTLSVMDPSIKLMENMEYGSDPNKLPEFTMRGSSSFSDMVSDVKGNPNLPLFILDGFEVGPSKIYDMDPNNVESITILKDASATAIYGSRAANGIIVVTTKVPEKGRLKIDVSTDVNFEVPDISDYNVLDSRRKLEYEVLAGLYDGSDEYTSLEMQAQAKYNEMLKLVNRGYDTDWLDKPLNNLGIGTKESVNINGGDNVLRYGIDFSYENKLGVMKESGRNRLNFGIKLQYQYKNFNFRNYLSVQKVKAYNSPYGDYSTYVRMNPYYPYKDENGNYKQILHYFTDAYGSDPIPVFNPLYDATLKHIDDENTETLTNNLMVSWAINNDMLLNIRGSISRAVGTSDLYISNRDSQYYNYDEDNFYKKGQYTKGNNENYSYSFNANYSCSQKINLNVFTLNAGIDIRETNYENIQYTVVGVQEESPTPTTGIEFMENSIPSGSESTTRNVGFYSNLTYGYDNKIFIDGSVRSDGSSQFGANSRWGTFWSAGAGYILSKEDFIKDLGFIDYLKLRSSIGTTGSQNFGAYNSIRTYNFIKDRRYNTDQGFILNTLDNPHLKWQKKDKFNVGFDFAVLDNIFSGRFDYYDELTADNLIDVSLPYSTGFPNYKGNLGKVRNNGVELSLNAMLFRNKENDSYLQLFANIMHNHNEIEEIAKELVAFNDRQDSKSSSLSAVSSKPKVRYIEGESFNTIWVVPSLGIDPADGRELFLKKDGSVTKTWSPEDYIPFHAEDPKFEGSCGATYHYKGFQISSMAAYRVGGYRYNQTLVDRVENSSPRGNVDERAFEQGWKQPGDVSFFKRPDLDGETTKPSSRFVEKENYLRLASINMSYRTNSKKLNKFGIKELKLTLYANDIATFSTIKQERGIRYPFARNYSTSLRITF